MWGFAIGTFDYQRVMAYNDGILYIYNYIYIYYIYIYWRIPSATWNMFEIPFPQYYPPRNHGLTPHNWCLVFGEWDYICRFHPLVPSKSPGMQPVLEFKAL